MQYKIDKGVAAIITFITSIISIVIGFSICFSVDTQFIGYSIFLILFGILGIFGSVRYWIQKNIGHKIKYYSLGLPHNHIYIDYKKNETKDVNLENFIRQMFNIKNSSQEDSEKLISEIHQFATNGLDNDINNCIFSIIFPTISLPIINNQYDVIVTNPYTFIDYIIFLFILYRLILYKEKNSNLIYQFSDIFDNQLKNLILHFNLLSDNEYEEITNHRCQKYDSIILSNPDDLLDALLFELEHFILQDIDKKPFEENIIVEEIEKNVLNRRIDITSSYKSLIEITSPYLNEFIDLYKLLDT